MKCAGKQVQYYNMSRGAPVQNQQKPVDAGHCREFLLEKQQAISVAHEGGATGQETALAYTHALDQVVRTLFAKACADAPSGVAVVATGGYGRGEMCPYSDLDLWFVISDGGADAESVRQIAEAVLYPLWDLKLEVGHAVRTVSEAIELGKQDLAGCTALLDLRLVGGDAQVFADLAGAVPSLFDRDPNRFVARLQTELSERRARLGEPVYLLEPNLKNGEGGVRDLLIGWWAAKARFRVRSFSELHKIGQASARQIQALEQAREFFLRLRTAAHLHARRKADRLTFEMQEAIAPRFTAETIAVQTELEGKVVRSAVAPAVESLMQQYFLHAKAVKRETARILERCHIESKRPTLRSVDASFVLFNGKLSAQDPQVFRKRPSEMVRIFNVASATGAELYGHTQELIADAAQDGDALFQDSHARVEFVELLCGKDARTPTLLEQAHGLGVLTAVLPEFAPCTARVQHDLYHVYTVDQHQLYAVARLKAIARGDLKQELPTATQAMAEVKSTRPLYLGTLLHDVGKPLGKGHSETGAELAETIARRLEFSDEEVAETAFLVRKHLLLSHLSQRRDLNDVAMIANLATELGDEEALHRLYLLTVADMSMVAPGNLTEWKEQLLSELYTRTLAHFRSGGELGETEETQLIMQRKQRVAELMGVPSASLSEWFSMLPERYVSQHAPRELRRHIELSRRRAGLVALEVVEQPRKGAFAFVLCAGDAPGLLAKIAGVLLAHRLDVLEAQIHSRKISESESEAIDVFTVRDRHGRLGDQNRWRMIEQDLARVIGGETSVESLIETRRERGSLPDRVMPAVRTEIEVDNKVSAEFSVLDIYAQDKIGVLYAITRTLAELRLDIQLSKVATEAARVADVFYVRERGGGKLTRERIDEVKLALGKALGTLLR